ncbi:MAG: hypothetical protein AB1656_00080 [Candidatus Omnitrophota bacterium]
MKRSMLFLAMAALFASGWAFSQDQGGAAVAPRVEFADLHHPKDWTAAHDVGAFRPAEGGFAFTCTGSDPYIISQSILFSAEEYKAIEIEMSVSDGSRGQLFWATQERPAFTETQSIHFEVKKDGLYHTYVLVMAHHAQWTGNISRLRLDAIDKEGEVKLRAFRILNYSGSKIEPLGFYPSAPFAASGETFQLAARFRNSGDAPAAVELELDYARAEAIVIQPLFGGFLAIPSGEEREARWSVKGTAECAVPLSCRWNLSGATKAEEPLYTIVEIADVDRAMRGVVLGSGDGRLTFVPTSAGYGPIRYQIRKNGEWKDAAWSPRLGTAARRLDDGSVQWTPVFSSEAPNADQEGNLAFSQTIKDQDGGAWNFQLETKKVSPVPGAIKFISTLTRTLGREGRLLHFSGPDLYAGQKSFGTQKDMAVLPGVEYIDKVAVSSSDAVAHPPVRDHYAPHPYKITIPYMALTYDGMLVSLLWPPNAPWSANETALSSKFAVPNRYYGQNNHLFGLFVPSVAKYVRENEESAFEPYIVKPGESIRIESAVYLAQDDDPNGALDPWLAIYGGGAIPEPQPAPRSYMDEIALSRQAYLTTCWNEIAKGWGHCAGWAPLSSAGMLALLSMDDFLCDDAAAKKVVSERVKLVYDSILAQSGEAGLASNAGCHVMTCEPSFYWGVTETQLPAWRRTIQGMVNSQNADGSWGYHPGSDEQKTLGREGEVVSGTISPNTMLSMRLARITADSLAANTGLKALEALNAQTVPRGAQGWECPLAAADILVSGHGARANLDAYRITGREEYLEKARYWARSGIGFHYLWNLPDRPLQRFATIPIFGTTFYTHSWRGVPVQWCGLVYAYALQELADFDNSQPWRKIARGIVHSAMLQQMTEGKYIGTLPDSYGDYFLTARGAYINPENIMTNLHALEGNSFDIRTVFLEEPTPEALRISANADIENAGRKGGGIEFAVHSKIGRKTEILIAPMPKAPQAVLRKNGSALPEVNPLFGNEEGWRYMGEYQTLLIHISHDAERMELSAQGPAGL